MDSNVFVRLFASRKFVVTALAVVVCGVLVALGRLTYQDMVTFLTVTIPAFLASVAIEDAAEKHSAKKDDGGTP